MWWHELTMPSQLKPVGKYIGMRWGIDLTPEMVTELTGMTTVRVIPHRTTITLEANSSRCNVYLEPDNITIRNIDKG